MCWADRLLAYLRRPLDHPGLLAAETAAPFAAGVFTPPSFLERGVAERLAAASLDLRCPFQSGRLLCTVVRTAADPSAPPVRDAVLAWLAHRLPAALAFAARVDPGGTGLFSTFEHLERDPAGGRAWLIATDVATAGAELLARSPAARIAARRSADLVAAAAALSERSPATGALVGLLACVDDFAIAAVAPGGRRAFRLVADGVRSNAHLFVLLHAALAPRLGHAESVDDGVVAWARGHEPRRPGDAVYAPWGFRQRGGAPCWPDESPRSIPPVAGRPAVAATTDPAERVWRADWLAPLHDAQRADVRVDAELGPAEVAALARTLAG